MSTDLYVVIDEGAYYDYHSYNNLFIVPSEEMAKMCVELLEEEKTTAFKIHDSYGGDVWRLSTEQKIKYNQEMRDNFKVMPLAWDVKYDTGEYALSICDSYWKDYHCFSYEQVKLKHEL